MRAAPAITPGAGDRAWPGRRETGPDESGPPGPPGRAAGRSRLKGGILWHLSWSSA